MDNIIEKTNVLEIKMQKRAKEFVYTNGSWISTKDIYLNDKIHLFQKYMTDKKLFWIDYEGTTLFPTYMFDENYEPLPIIAKLIDIFSTMSFWHIAIWLESINGDFNSKSPKEFLISDPEKVLKSAIESLKPIEHG